MIQLTQVHATDIEFLKFIERIYTESFPPDERRDFSDVIRLLEENDDFFIVLADVFEHILDAVSDFIGVFDRRKIAPSEPLVKETVLYALLPPVPLGAVIFMLFQFARHLTFRYVSKRVEV